MAIFMPTNQKRLTNVSIVRLRKGGKRFEVATYPNKVKAWRDHLETDLDEVLQTQTVFLNVSKGEEAKKDLLEKIFNTSDKEEICKQILLKGEIQVTGKERHSNLDALFSDVAKMISQKCINPSTQRAYSVAIIERAMRACHVKLLPTRSAKQQAAEANHSCTIMCERKNIHILRSYNITHMYEHDVIGILQESGQLNLEVTLLQVHLELSIGEKISATTAHRIRKLVHQEAAEVTIDELDELVDLKMEFLIEPGALNEMEGRIRDESRGRYQMDISRSDMTKSTLAAKEVDEPHVDEKEITDKVASMAIGKGSGDKSDCQKKRRRRAKKGNDDESTEREIVKEKEVKEDQSDEDWNISRQKKRGRHGKRVNNPGVRAVPQRESAPSQTRENEDEDEESANDTDGDENKDVKAPIEDEGTKKKTKKERRRRSGKRHTQT